MLAVHSRNAVLKWCHQWVNLCCLLHVKARVFFSNRNIMLNWENQNGILQLSVSPGNSTARIYCCRGWEAVRLRMSPSVWKQFAHSLCLQCFVFRVIFPLVTKGTPLCRQWNYTMSWNLIKKQSFFQRTLVAAVWYYRRVFSGMYVVSSHCCHECGASRRSLFSLLEWFAHI